METVSLVEKALNVRTFYHKILSSNIANVETPGYKEKDMDFGKALESSAGSDQTKIPVQEKQVADGLNSIDGNTVNMEDQITKLTENNLYFTSLARVISKKFAMMRYAISEGKG
jgi:flagellar basal-body rod protein FlgB